MAVKTFRIPNTIHYGAGALELLGSTTAQVGLRRVLIVTDAGILSMGLVARAAKILAGSGIESAVFAGVRPDPTVENVEAGLKCFRSESCDGIVAIGGGSPIDCAKAISVQHTNPVALSQFMGQEKISEAGVPVVAVPTTAGTGSEATRIMVITDTQRDVKMMIASRFGVCAAAIVDPELTVSMPPSLTGPVGVDAMTHAIEAYVSRKSQPMTDVLALSAIRLIGANLRRAYQQGSDIEARSAVMLGSLQAGMAFSNSSVALVHGMARPLGACFHLSHGQSIAVLLPVVTEFSLAASVERYRTIAEILGEANLADGLLRLNRDLRIPTLRDLGIDVQRYESLLPKMAVDAMDSGSPANNPRLASPDEIIELYRECWHVA